MESNIIDMKKIKKIELKKPMSLFNILRELELSNPNDQIGIQINGKLVQIKSIYFNAELETFVLVPNEKLIITSKQNK